MIFQKVGKMSMKSDKRNNFWQAYQDTFSQNFQGEYLRSLFGKSPEQRLCASYNDLSSINEFFKSENFEHAFTKYLEEQSKFNTPIASNNYNFGDKPISSHNSFILNDKPSGYDIIEKSPDNKDIRQYEIKLMVGDKNEPEAQRLIKFRELLGWSQAELARNIHLEQQAVSRFEAALKDPKKKNLANNAPATIKYALLKYCYYDIEDNTIIKSIGNFVDSSYVKEIPFYEDKKHKDNALNGQTMYMDIRWLRQDMNVSPSDLCIVVAPDNSMNNENPIKNISYKDLLLVDTSSKAPTKIEGVYAVETKAGIRIYRVVSDWNGNSQFYTSSPEQQVQAPSKDEYNIIGKVIWNGSYKVQ